MTLSEASRQYQCALEGRRRLRTEHAASLSAQDILDAGDENVADTYRYLLAVWADAQFKRATAYLVQDP